MHAKSLRQDAGDSRQDGGAPLRRMQSFFSRKLKNSQSHPLPTETIII